MPSTTHKAQDAGAAASVRTEAAVGERPDERGLAAGVMLELDKAGHASEAGAVGRGGRAVERDELDASLEEAVERAFLSPRVIDQAAFDALSSKLRALTQDAQTQVRALTATTTQAASAHVQMREQVQGVMRDLQARADAAVKAMPVLEARVGRAQALLDRVTNETALSKAREVRDAVLAEVAQQRDALVRQAVQDALDQARRKLEADLATMVRQALDQARADAILGAREAGREIARASGQSLAEHAGPSTGLAGDANGAVNAAQLGELVRQAQAAMLELERGTQRMQDDVRAMQATVEEALARASAGQAELASAFARAQAQLQAASSDAERRTESAATEIAEQLLALREDATRLVEQARGQMLAGVQRGGVETGGTLLVAPAERQRLIDEARREVIAGSADAVRANLEATLKHSLAADLEETLLGKIMAQVVPLARSVSEQAAARWTSGSTAGSGDQPSDSAADGAPVVEGAGERAARLTRVREQVMLTVHEGEALMARLERVQASAHAAAARCDEKAHALVGVMDTIEARLEALGAQGGSAGAGAGEAMPHTAAVGSGPSVLEGEQRVTEQHLREQLLAAQQQLLLLQQATMQAGQVGQWLAGLLQRGR